MKATLILCAILALLLAGCTTAPSYGSTAPDTSVYTFMPSLSPNTSIAAAVSGKIGLISTNASDTSVNVTILGRNASGGIKEILTLNGTTPVFGTGNYTNIDKITLNATTLGTVRMNDSGNATIATLSPNMTVAYNVAALDGSNYAVPAIAANTSNINVNYVTEYTLFTNCGTFATTNVSWSYWVSPDGVKYYAGAVALPSCNNSLAKTQLTDTGVRFIKLGYNSPDNVSNQLYAKLVAR